MSVFHRAMRIYLDNIVFSLQKAGGISVYWYELARRLQDQADVYFIDSKNTVENLFGCQLNVSRERLYSDLPIPLAVNRYLPTTVRLPRQSLFHSSYYRVAWQPMVANVVTVHDFTYEFFRAGLPRLVNRLQKWFALVRADGIICDSENTRKDMLTFYPALRHKRQTVIHLGADSAFRPHKKKAAVQLHPEKYRHQPFVLFIGDRRPNYKNFKVAVMAVGLLKNYRLAIVGGNLLSPDEQRFVESHVGKRYEIYCAPNTEFLNDLYNGAFCLLYPSLYEGFGLPVLEALRSGCPVVTTNRSSIPEVIGNSGLVLNEVTPASLANAVKGLENPEVREKYIFSGFKQASRFSWHLCASETLKFYQQVHDDCFLRKRD
ncbi:MAG: glycosyltransferase family 1 protein [Desulfobacterales bacterium]|nr:glycosyltransferase family 1 protein [Desulfobacterales bacterium]